MTTTYVALPTCTTSLARVPPFPQLKRRIEWAYRHCGKEPSSAFGVSVTSKVSLTLSNMINAAENGLKRTLCLLCNVELAENCKTKNRHMGTLQHLINIAEELQVDLDTLRLDFIRCDDCGREYVTVGSPSH